VTDQIRSLVRGSGGELVKVHTLGGYMEPRCVERMECPVRYAQSVRYVCDLPVTSAAQVTERLARRLFLASFTVLDAAGAPLAFTVSADGVTWMDCLGGTFHVDTFLEWTAMTRGRERVAELTEGTMRWPEAASGAFVTTTGTAMERVVYMPRGPKLVVRALTTQAPATLRTVEYNVVRHSDHLGHIVRFAY
jgi:hypothetical protein